GSRAAARRACRSAAHALTATTNLQVSSRAALVAALLGVLLACMMLQTIPAEAKLRTEKLWLLTSTGQEIPIDAEIADDADTKALGLMFRTELADDEGML